MSDDSKDDKFKTFRENMVKKAKSRGYTDYEIDERTAATEFLFYSFYKFNKHCFLMKQIPYLLKPDTMSDVDWADYLELSWEVYGLFLGSKKALN
jgi:hypothetical protein